MANETVVTVVGNLTADPELKYLESGVAVVSFTIASTPRVFDKASNDWKDAETLFLPASAWREFAENIAAGLHKGAHVVAQGNLKQRNWEKDGEKRSRIELDVTEIGLAVLRTKPNAQRAGGRAQPAGGGVAPGLQQPMSQDSWNTPSYSDEVPF